MAALAQSIENYIRAKDHNRPHLLMKAFTPDATVEIVVDTPAISFPPSISGLDAIADVLVRQFGHAYENVYTFCLADPPGREQTRFTCAWLVGMSDKHDQSLRVGIGLYDWRLGSVRVEALKITVTWMLVLAPATQTAIMRWLSGLPYPWCPVEEALAAAPQTRDLRDLLARMRALAATAK